MWGSFVDGFDIGVLKGFWEIFQFEARCENLGEWFAELRIEDFIYNRGIPSRPGAPYEEDCDTAFAYSDGEIGWMWSSWSIIASWTDCLINR